MPWDYSDMAISYESQRYFENKAIEEAWKQFRRASLVPLEVCGREITVRDRPYLNRNYSQVLQFWNKGLKPLLPHELEELVKKVNPMDQSEGNNYIDLPVHETIVPSWTSQGMGIVFDPEGIEPSKYRGKFVIGEIRDVDSVTGRVFPNYDKILILNDGDLENFLSREWKDTWGVDEKTGLSIPLFGDMAIRNHRDDHPSYKLDKHSLQRERKEHEKAMRDALFRPFSPLVYFNPGQIRASHSEERFNFWAEKI